MREERSEEKDLTRLRKDGNVHDEDYLPKGSTLC